MFRKTLIFLVLAAAAAFGVFHYLKNGGTARISITREMIDEALERKFPVSNSYAAILNVRYENPVVEFLPGQDRIRVELDVHTSLGLEGLLAKSFTGNAAVTTALGYDPASSRFSLVDPRIEGLELPGLSERHLAILRDGMNVATLLWFDNIPVYRIKDKDLKTRITKMTLREVTVKKDRIIATLGLPPS